MFNRKKNEIERLQFVLQARSTELDKALAREKRVLRQVSEMEDYIRELEQTNQPSYDMNVLFAAVLDYRRVVKHLCAPDPIEGRNELRRIFDKYKVKF